MFRTALLVLALATGGGVLHFDRLLDLVSGFWADQGDAGSRYNPNGLAAPGDAGNSLDPDGAAATGDAGGHLDPNG